MKRTKRATDINHHLYDACGGRPQHQEEETLSDHSSVTLDQIEKELMELKGNKGGKSGKGGPRILQLLWKIWSSFE